MKLYAVCLLYFAWVGASLWAIENLPPWVAAAIAFGPFVLMIPVLLYLALTDGGPKRRR